MLSQYKFWILSKSLRFPPKHFIKIYCLFTLSLKSNHRTAEPHPNTLYLTLPHSCLRTLTTRTAKPPPSFPTGGPTVLRQPHSPSLPSSLSLTLRRPCLLPPTPPPPITQPPRLSSDSFPPSAAWHPWQYSFHSLFI